MRAAGYRAFDAGPTCGSNSRVQEPRSSSGPPPRACGPCSLCCTLLRVDELAKLGGTRCLHQGAGGGCEIHPRRPAICRSYRCLWLQGALEPADRPDRLGAVLDLVSRGGFPELVVHEAEPGAVARSARLREIVDEYRRAMPVRILDTRGVLDPDHPFRVLLPDGDERRVAGERVETWRDGARVGVARLGWLERIARRIAIGVRRIRLRRHRRGPRSAGASRRVE
jgi:hypothetical protein